MTVGKDVKSKDARSRRRLLGLGAGAAGLLASSQAQASWRWFCFDHKPCFVAGTMIETVDGPVAVEDLSVGDELPTHFKGTQKISWIGSREEQVTTFVSPPVRIAKDAFGKGQPYQDLLVSADHAVFIDGVLVPAKELINGHSIAFVETALGTTVTYYHVELPAHDVIEAQGLATESYRENGNRHAFDKDGAARASNVVTLPCAPILTLSRSQAALEFARNVFGRRGQVRETLDRMKENMLQRA